MSSSSIASSLIRFLIHISGVESGVLLGLSRDENLWLLTLLQFLIAGERLVQVIIHQQAHLHHFLVFEGGYQLEELWLHLLESAYQIGKRIVILRQV